MRKFQSSLYEGSEPDILETIFKLSGKIAYDSCFFYRSEKIFKQIFLHTWRDTIIVPRLGPTL